jgi:ribonucleoside-diphosphate reductase alpha chain
MAEPTVSSGESHAPKITSELDGRTELEGIRRDVFLDRYSLKDKESKPTELYPEQMWARVANGIAKVEKSPELRKHWAGRFYEVLRDFKFMPGGRILAGAGTDYNVTFYNCFVIPSPHDSRGGIIDNLKIMVEIMSHGGGVGINLSSLRPRGARVKKVNGTSSGPVTWGELYSVGAHDVVQQGGTRRGALMLMLWDWHPDIEEFIDVKKDLTKIKGANLSVCVSDKFMEAVKADQDWNLVFPDITDPEYDEKWDGDLEKWKALGKKVNLHKVVKAKEVWDKICQAAWASAEPGLHFLERSNERSNTWYFERLICTNPCGEQPLGPWAVCNLGAINLSAFVEGGKMHYEKLAEHVRTSVRFLDNVIDANKHFYPEIEEQQAKIRRIGLGTLGLGDALIKMKVRYGSEACIQELTKIYKLIRDEAYMASVGLAQEKGAFPKFDKEKYLQGHFIKQLPDQIRGGIDKYGIRNAVLLTQAPTGSTGLLAGASSGIEPVFDFSFIRKDRTGEHTINHPLYQKWLDNYGGNGEIKPDYLVTANELTPDDHVKVQAVIQSYTDSSISKTVNAPSDHSVDDVKNLYMMAYDLGLKGITYMRDGSREGVLTRVEKKVEVTSQASIIERPDILDAKVYRIKTPVGTAFITVCSDENNKPFEMFITVGKAGSDIMADAEAIGRLVSLNLRTPHVDPVATLENIIVQLKGIGGSNITGFGKNQVRSLADSIAKVLEQHLGNRENIEPTKKVVPLTKDLCPACGDASFIHEEGCKKCLSCGYSAC